MQPLNLRIYNEIYMYYYWKDFWWLHDQLFSLYHQMDTTSRLADYFIRLDRDPYFQ